MERLTIRDNNGEAHMICKQMCGDYGHQCDGQIDVDMCQRYVAFDKLADYEDLEEQGLLLKLPCKVGDTVYAIGFNKKPVVYESVVLSILITEKEIVFNVKVDEFEINSQLKQSMFGKTVFLTQEEAEAKLNESEE